MITAALIRRAVAPLWALHERSPYLRVWRDLRRAERMSADERRARQWTMAVELVDYAWRNCPYYRKRFQATGFEPGDLKDWSDFERLPVLTKSDITSFSEEMISATAERSRLVSRKTSGSTGVSLQFFVDDAEFQFKRGVACYRDGWTGWRLGEWRAEVWGNPEYLRSFRGRLRNALLERRFPLDTLKMDERMMHEFARMILRRRPTLLFGHAHSLYLFARFWEENGYADYSFRGIISTAMVLHGFEREKCEKVFATRVFDRYGCEEVSLVASECEAHQGLHENTDSLVIEIQDGARPCENGETGAVIVTDLRNFAMPFIRYQVGDMASRKPGSCPCGRTYPLLDCVVGRVADYLRTPEGHWVSGISLTENFATLIPGLKQVQIIQETPVFLRLRIVPGSGFGEESRTRIREMVAVRFGPRMSHAIDVVDRIEPEPSGKYRFSIYRVGFSNKGEMLEDSGCCRD